MNLDRIVSIVMLNFMLFSAALVSSRVISVNARLTDTLLERISRKMRPVSHPHQALKVNVLSALYQIVDVDQRSNLVTISAYFDLWWHDRHLIWNASDYEGTDRTYLPSDSVWAPDLYLYHSVQGSTPLAIQQSAVQISNDGTVRVFIPFTARALCMINVKYFPFDTQQCQFVFGSWSYKLESVEYMVASEEVLLSDFYDNQEWRLSTSSLQKTVSLYANSAFNETYSTVTLIVQLQRQSFYYVFNLVLPVTLVTLVSVIGFHVPANSSERRESKFRLGIMTLLSMGVLLLNVVNDMPKFSMRSEPGQRGSFSDVPILGLFYLALILIISVGTMSTGVFVMLERHALDHPEKVSWWLQWLNFDVNWYKNINKKLIKRRRQHRPDQQSPKSIGEREAITSTANAVAKQLTVEHKLNVLNDEPKERNCISSPNTRNMHPNCNEKLSTPPSYRQAVLSPMKGINRFDSEEELHCKNTNNKPFICAVEKLCSEILFETKLIRETFDYGRDLDGPTVAPAVRRLTVEWRRTLHRLECFSLLIYIGLVVTSVVLFFFNGWY